MPDATPRDPLPDILTLNSVNLLIGASGIGKTALIASMARAFLDGTPLFGKQTNACPVGYIAADRPIESARRWFAHYNLELPTYSLVDDHAYDLRAFSKGDQHTKILSEFLDKLNLPPGSLIFVDPIGLFVGGTTIDYVRVAMGFIRLGRLAKSRGICLLGVDHTAKQVADKKERYLRPQDRITGSMAKSGFSGTQIYLMAPEEAGADVQYYQLSWNSHHAKSETVKLMKDESNGLFLPWDEARKSKAPHGHGKDVISKEALTLLELIPSYPSFISTAAIIQQSSDIASRRTVFRRLRELENHGYVLQLRHGIWQKCVNT